MPTPKKRISKRHAARAALPLFLLGALLACLAVSLVNDVYAFVKPDAEIIFALDAPTDAREISRTLRELGAIRNDLAFSLYVSSKQKTAQLEAASGKWTLNSNMSYREILGEITK